MGTLAESFTSKKWDPKEWHPVYEQVVALAAAGWSNEKIGSIVGLGKQQISNILTSPKGKTKLTEYTNTVAVGAERSIHSRLARLTDVTVTRCEQYFDNDEYHMKAPGAMADRAMKFLRGIGQLKDDAPVSTVNNITFKDAQIAVLANSMKRSEEAKALAGDSNASSNEDSQDNGISG